MFVALSAAVPVFAQSDFEAIKARAEAGDAQAQYDLGVMYDIGEGVVQDDVESAKWHRLAAEQGNANSQFILGAMYKDGEGVAQNYQEAVKWYRLAAEQGDALAQFFLGDMYGDGRGVTQSYAKAYLWFSLAVAGGETYASAHRDNASARLSPQALEEAKTQATRCFESNFQDCD